MKIGLLLEGGAMRGLYTAGVLDSFMEHNIKIDGILGVSAGALFGMNYKSKQIGRAVRYNKKYAGNRNYMGFYSFLNAVSTMNEVFTSRNIELPLENMGTVEDENRYEKGLEIQHPIYGDEIKDKFQEYPETARFLTAFCFGDFYTRNGLDIKTRELLVLVILTTLNLTTQIKSHVIGNLKVGNNKETLYYAMLQCMPYIGFPNVAMQLV